ncbi:HAD family hydrolase [Desulfotalea psychrophila]|uniref:HAD family hydrolase n=1 Tax=Desulfotalea psychrophila (strain LSv54 / DSM 12343) TaxID=177439 RepID=Q6AP04_DESPS|nr:HAD-IA family hydrolase [Desulfotalea psychrophila]CAG35920.1 hypothetical protein DP1191 [Desulfotalea psychrophila LSv54]
MMKQIEGVTFDFYETLIHCRNDISRGKAYMHYLMGQGLQAAPWQHDVIYDIFEYYADAYAPNLSEYDKVLFWQEFTRRLFTRTDVSTDGFNQLSRHTEAIRDIFSPGYFQLYPEVIEVLDRLSSRDLLLGVISNWPRGLACFCQELGIFHQLGAIVSSAEIGIEKPDPEIFREASRQLHLSPEAILHIGDQLWDDVNGAKSAGCHAVWLNRGGGGEAGQVISNLSEIEGLIEEINRSIA